MSYLGYKITNYYIMPQWEGRRIIEELVVEHDNKISHYIEGIKGKWQRVTKTEPTRCNQCNENGSFNGYVNSSAPARFICDECWYVISCMIEYSKNPHPLLKELTKFEYINFCHRELKIMRACWREKRLLRQKNFLAAELLTKNEIPRELTPIINLFHLQKICRDFRVSMSYFK